MDKHQLPTMSCEEKGPHPTQRSSADNNIDPQGLRRSIPSLRVHRFVALIFISLLGFGSYFCFNMPSNLQYVLWRDHNVSYAEVHLLYSICKWPAVVSCFVGGFLIDHVFGVRLGTVIYLFMVLIGQLIFATGGLFNTFWLMMCGRFIFGIGGKSLLVTQKNYAVLWFKGKELNLVFGLELLIGQCGTLLHYWEIPPIYDYFTKFYDAHRALGGVLLLAGGTCVLSFICALVLGCMDERAECTFQRNNNPTEESPKLSDISKFKITFWMVAVICVAYYVAVLPFIQLTTKKFFMDRFQFAPHRDLLLYFLPMSSIASLILGFVIDKIGNNLIWVFAAIVSTISAHILLTFTLLHPYVGLVIMGLAYSIMTTSIWSFVALIIPEHQLGSAYGLCLSLQNLGRVVTSEVAVMIAEKSDGTYVWVELLYLGWLTIALIATFVIRANDVKTKGNLNTTPTQSTFFNQYLLHLNGKNIV